jgi:hypothetical protein
MIIGKHLSDEEAAEKLMRHRARWMPVLILSLVFVQVVTAIKVYTTGYLATGGWTGWLLMIFLVLNIVATGAPGFAGRPGMRTYIDDELTISHRAKAYAIGFWALLLLGIALLVASNWFALDARLALHSVVGLGAIAAATRYTMLERRALKA